MKTGIMLGDGGSSSIRLQNHKANAEDPENEEHLKKSIRAHGNFSESTPFAFFLIFLAELNGAPTSLVHGAFASLFVARLLHGGALGLRNKDITAIGRPAGSIATNLVIFAAGVYNLSLGFEPLKSWLGFK